MNMTHFGQMTTKKLSKISARGTKIETARKKKLGKSTKTVETPQQPNRVALEDDQLQTTKKNQITGPPIQIPKLVAR